MNWRNALVVVVVAALAAKFAADNAAGVFLRLFGVGLRTPLYAPVLVAFLLGFAGGVLAMNFPRRKHKREIARLREENARMRKELENLRNLPLQDDP